MKEFISDTILFGKEIRVQFPNIKNIYWVPKSWMIMASILAQKCWFNQLFDEEQINVNETLIVDEIIESWRTLANPIYNWCKKAVLYGKGAFETVDMVFEMKPKNEFIHLPFEKHDDIENHITRILEFIGEDVLWEHCIDTPKRVKKSYWRLFDWYKKDPKDIFTTFSNESHIDQIVWLSNIPVNSHCSHHLLPFIGTAQVYYIPNKTICGISKLARVVDIYARRLQTQERLAKQIADFLEKELKPKWVAVVIKAQHMCMRMRWVETEACEMHTNDLRWLFFDDPKARMELFSMIWK